MVSILAQIYVDLEDKSDPESGKAALASPVTGTAGPMGYYTVPLEQKVKLAQGQSFAVVIGMESAGQVGFVVEASRTSNGILKSQALAEEGQSFVNLYGNWQDWGKGGKGYNVRIKAFTRNCLESEIPEETPAPTPVPVPTEPPAPKDFPFKDVAVDPDGWRYESIKFVYENDIMNGITNPEGIIDTFDPESSLTRGMFATVLYRMAGNPAVTFENRFSDVQSGAYYSDAVIWAYQNGIVNGYPNGTFGINDNITREQIAKMLMVYADEVKHYDISEKAEITSFPDVSDVAGWAVDYIRWAVGCKMINGSNINGTYYLNPKGEATRVECAAMLNRFQVKYEG